MSRVLVILTALLGLSCGEEGETLALEGSVSRIYDLSHTGVRARLSDSELAIQYLAGRESVVQVIVDLDEEDVGGPATIDLTSRGRVIGSRDGNVLPEFVSGRLVLSEFEPSNGANVAGNFEAQVSSADNEYSVRGTFFTALQDLRQR